MDESEPPQDSGAAEWPEDAKMSDVKKPENETKKQTDEVAAKNAKEDADKKKSHEDAAQKKSEADATAKKAEAKSQDDLNKHMTQPVFMLTQAGVQMMKDNPDLGKNGKWSIFPPSTTKQWRISYTRSAELSWLSADSRM